MISLIVNVDDPNQSGLLETFASVRKTEQTNFVISGEELTFFHRPVKVSETATQPWEDDWLETDAFEFAIGLPGEDFVAYSDTYTAANPGVNGTITVNTVAVVAAFANTTDDALPFVFSIKRTRVSGEVAEYYQAHCTLKRSVINPGSAIPTPSASYYTKTESDARFEPSLGNPSTNGYVLSSTTAGVRSWVSGGGGGSGTAYLYADQTFTGINNFGVGTFDPSDSTFGDSPTLRLASGSYVMVAGDETGEAGVISNSGGSLVLESALGTNYNVGQGIMYGLPGGTLNLGTQALTGDWSFTGAPSVIMSGDAPPTVILSRGVTAKSRLMAMKSLEATQPLWTGFAMTVNADYDATLGTYVYDDDAQTILVLDNEHQWYNPTDRWYQSELNWQANGRRVLNLWTKTQSEVTTVSSGSGVGGVTVTTADNHNFAIGTSVYISVAGTSPALAGTFTVVATPSAKTFTFTPATAITGVSTAAQRGTVRATSGNTTVSVASFQVLSPFSVSVPEYDTTDTAEKKIALFEGYSSSTAVPVTMRLQNSNSGNSASSVCLQMKGFGNTGGTWWDISAGYDASSGAYVHGLEIANRLGGGYGVRIRPKSGSASTTQIGINKETPAKELDVVGDGRFTGDVSAATLSGITSLSDSNGEPLLNFIATTDAVNQITIVNGATGNAPVITSTGSDADVGLIIGTAGAGNLELGSLGLIAFTGSVAQDVNGAASKPAALFAGTPFAGTGTTSFPLVYINDADATASTTLNTAGTYFGVNGNGTQDLMNLLKDGASVFKVASNGAVTALAGSFTTLAASGARTFATSDISTTALATPSSLSATQYTAFASTVGGASIMGYGTTNDVSLRNRAGTICLGVGPNTTAINIPGTISVVGNITSNSYLQATQLIVLQGNAVTFRDGGNTSQGNIKANGTDSIILKNGADNANGSLTLLNLTATGISTHTGGAVLGTKTVGTLPTASSNTYLSFIVTDALTPVLSTTVSAGGSAKAAVRSNGTNWIVTEVL